MPSTSRLLKITNDLEMITYSIPCAVCLAMSSSCSTSNLLSVTWIWRYKVEPSHHWVTIASSGLAMQPINKRIFTWRVFLRRATKYEILRRVVIFPFLVLRLASALVFVRRKTNFSWTTGRQAVSKMTDNATAYSAPHPPESLKTHPYTRACVMLALENQGRFQARWLSLINPGKLGKPKF